MLKRVMVVDDDKEIQEIVTFVLNHNGFEGAVASNGQELQGLGVADHITKPFHPLDLVEKIHALLGVTT